MSIWYIYIVKYIAAIQVSIGFLKAHYIIINGPLIKTVGLVLMNSQTIFKKLQALQQKLISI